MEALLEAGVQADEEDCYELGASIGWGTNGGSTCNGSGSGDECGGYSCSHRRVWCAALAWPVLQ